MKLNTGVVAFFFVSLAGSISAFEQPARLPGVNATSLAMGGAVLGVKKPTAALFANPANLPGLKEKIELNVERVYMYERRFHSDSTFVANGRTAYGIPQAAFVVSTDKIGFGGGYSVETDFGYVFQDVVTRDRGWGSLTGMDDVRIDGSFNQLGVGFGFAPSPAVSCGLTYLRGSGTRNEKITFLSVKNQDINKSEIRTVENLSGDTLLAGVVLKLKEHISLSFAATGGFDVNVASESFRNGEKTGAAGYAQTRSPAYGMGFEYKMGEISLLYEAGYISAGDSGYKIFSADSYYLKTGIAMPAGDETRVMGGFFTAGDSGSSATFFSLGFEKTFAKTTLGGALAFGKKGPSSRPRYFPLSPGDFDYAENKILRILLSVSFSSLK